MLHKTVYVIKTKTFKNSGNSLPICIMEGLKYILIITLLKTCVHAKDPAINTTTGTIQGSTISVQNVELDVFLGIPFAKPPVGDLRFRRPEPIERWSGIKETKHHVSTCEQLRDEMFKDLPGMDMWEIKTNITEDCLYLNIWSPTEARKSRSNLTTMIWIYGGGFTTGSSTLGAYDGRWLAASKNIIVASLNYRVGPFGFLSLNDDRAPGNMGLLDQYLAIKWIRDNIASFGGDPDKLTLFGESAGAVSISMHVISPMSRNLFRNAIIMSGTSNTDWAIKSKKENVDRAKELATFLNCTTESEKHMLDCFLNADAKDITRGQFQSVGKFTEIIFAPVIDNYFLKGKPIDVLQNEKIKNDVLLGFVKNEGSLFILTSYSEYFGLNGPVPINSSTAHTLLKKVIEPVQLNTTQIDLVFYLYGSNVYSSSETEKYRYVLEQVAGDTIFKCPAIKFSQDLSTHSNVYMYSFEYRSSGTYWPEWMGVTHGSEILYVFSRALYAQNSSSEDKSVSEMISSYFANFSKSGNPNNGDCSNCSNEPWSKFTRTNKKYFVIDEKPKMENRDTSMYSVCDFWSDLLPKLKTPSCPEPSGSQNLWAFQGRILTTLASIFLSLNFLR